MCARVGEERLWTDAFADLKVTHVRLSAHERSIFRKPRKYARKQMSEILLLDRVYFPLSGKGRGRILRVLTAGSESSSSRRTIRRNAFLSAKTFERSRNARARNRSGPIGRYRFFFFPKSSRRSRNSVSRRGAQISIHRR